MKSSGCHRFAHRFVCAALVVPLVAEVLPMSFLTLANVNKSYGATRAVADMNLSVEKGEFVSLLGPSGCGKTTTLQMIAGFCEVTSGQVTLDGRDITHAKPNSRGL